MSFKSNGTSSSHNNEIKGEAVGAKPTKNICKIPIKKMYRDVYGLIKHLYIVYVHHNVIKRDLAKFRAIFT